MISYNLIFVFIIIAFIGLGILIVGIYYAINALSSEDKSSDDFFTRSVRSYRSSNAWGSHSLNESEKAVARILSELPVDKYRVINGVLLQTDRGTTEIDHIVVSIYGIFVIETKDYYGYIVGEEHAKEWTKEVNGEIQTFYNPLRQNYGHVKALEKILNISEYKFIPVVVFTSRAELNVDYSASAPVIYIERLKDEIESWYEIEFNETELDEITNRILVKNIDSLKNRSLHVQQIKQNVGRNQHY